MSSCSGATGTSFLAIRGQVLRKHLAVPDAGLLFDQVAVVVVLGDSEIGSNPSESTSAFRMSGEFLRVTAGLCANIYFSEGARAFFREVSLGIWQTS